MSKQKILLTLLLISGILLMMSGMALAEVIQYDGYSLNYSLNNSAHTAEVSGITDISKSELNVTIPENITVNGTKYYVTSIGDSAFSNCSPVYRFY